MTLSDTERTERGVRSQQRRPLLICPLGLNCPSYVSPHPEMPPPCLQTNLLTSQNCLAKSYLLHLVPLLNAAGWCRLLYLWVVINVFYGTFAAVWAGVWMAVLDWSSSLDYVESCKRVKSYVRDRTLFIILIKYPFLFSVAYLNVRSKLIADILWRRAQSLQK